MQKYKALKRDRLFLPARSKCWIPHVLKETQKTLVKVMRDREEERSAAEVGDIYQLK